MSGQIAVSMRFRVPAESLRDLITSYYMIEVQGPPAATVEDLLQPEWGNLRIRLRSEWQALDDEGRPVEGLNAALFGPTSHARPVIARPGKLLGIGFTPLGWTILIRTPADALADAIAEPQGELGESIAALREDLLQETAEEAMFARLDAFFEERAHGGNRKEAQIRAVHAALLDPELATVEGLVGRTGLSQSVLGRVCMRSFGFTPKLLLQRQRFLRTLAVLANGDPRPIGQLLDGAYVDHSHFNRDFKRFMGLSPSEYLAMPRLILKAAMGSRDRALGAALQGLHELATGTS
ncbi:AraC family transcriptional regulator [Sphingomonas sp. ID1715]|uniref:AraC family transcriptional regulator n=1 Tax=Sphingomonas sp. ID1715 TaxID=1656898 RepID=UPI0014895DC5|nr:helix-turn-helix domain-containing protein [Sphingomonas sp. ID1715]NNM76104.1 AraC family transcriptional regulator [Sphingomonas sp. ID1715]